MIDQSVTASQDSADRDAQTKPCPKEAKKQPLDTMLAYFLTTLEVRTIRIEPTLGQDQAKLNLLNEVKKKVFNARDALSTTADNALNHTAWTEAYRLERILALIEPGDSLVAELKKRSAEASDEGLASAPRLVAAADAAIPFAVDTSQPLPSLRPGGEELLRWLLLDTLEELHWAAQRKFCVRPIQRQATKKIVVAGLIAFGFFLLPYLYTYGCLLFKREPSVTTWSGLPLYTAMTAGLFGAFFSRLLYLQQKGSAMSVGAIREANDNMSILLRGCVGMSGAVIMYFFLQSDVIAGNLFPHFDQVNFNQLKYPDYDPQHPEIISMRLFNPNRSLALLVIWCFIAGFSERLVPSILQTTEATIGKSLGGK